MVRQVDHRKTFLLITLGSLGDFMPFLALADRLRNKGHRVVIASNAGYANMAQAIGIEFAAIWERSNQSLDELIAQNPARAWDAVREQMFVPAIEPARLCIRHYVGQGDCTVIAAWTALGARLERRETHFPLATLYLSPGALEHDGDRNPDETCIGLFPEWYQNIDDLAQPGFVMLDDALLPPLPSDLEGFLHEGPAPVLFTPGSYMRGANRFFRSSLTACEMLDLRAVFLTPYSDQVPALPSNVRYYRYVPLRRLAPRASLIVHHGGIGTCADALRAALPQLISPLFFDQPDNAARLKQLGVGEVLPPNAYEPSQLSLALNSLLKSLATKQNCRNIAPAVNENAGDRACVLFEELSSQVRMTLP